MRLDYGRLQPVLNDMKNTRRMTRRQIEICHGTPSL